MKIVFTVFGKPRPQAQNRTQHVYEKCSDGKMRPKMVQDPRTGMWRALTVHPNPKDTVNWRSDAKAAALAAMGDVDGVLFPDGPLRMDVDMYFERPKSRPKWIAKSAWITGGPVRTTAGCDRSNLLKTLEDALQGVCYRNDSQLADGSCRKFYAAGPGYGDTRPRVEVRIEEIREDDPCVQDSCDTGSCSRPVGCSASPSPMSLGL